MEGFVMMRVFAQIVTVTLMTSAIARMKRASPRRLCKSKKKTPRMIEANKLTLMNVTLGMPTMWMVMTGMTLEKAQTVK
jgi:hypothetical protein